jgi:two-component system chemotaxis response regulator CheB
MSPPDKRRILIVDDSAVMRKLLETGIRHSGDLDVVATARDAYEAWDKIKEFSPDAITLDVHMPRMDGLVFLERLMRQHPMPVVMVSSITQDGCEATLRALELGALDFVTKPAQGANEAAGEMLHDVVCKLRRAIAVGVAHQSNHVITAGAPVQRIVSGAQMNPRTVGLVLGGNSGGTEALRQLVRSLSKHCPPTVISHFLPAPMQRVMIAQLQRQCQAEVREARAGDEVKQGLVLIAPLDLHIAVNPSEKRQPVVSLTRGTPLNGCRPSVDLLFQSCAKVWGNQSTAILLDGIGADGRAGLRELTAAGATAIFQCEATGDAERCAWVGNSTGAKKDLPIRRMPLKDIRRLLSTLTAA